MGDHHFDQRSHDSQASRGDPECSDEKPRWFTDSRNRSFSTVTTIIASTSLFLLPSFALRFLKRNEKTRSRSPAPHPTAYLDGLRGVAAFAVYVYHFGTMWGLWIFNGYGSTVNDRYLIQLSFVRLLAAGKASVTLFFVISGYVLSIKTLTLIHKRQHSRILEVLSSSVFRRPFRLFLPIIVVNAVIATLAQARFPFQNNAINGYGAPPTLSSPYLQFRHWLDSVGHIFYVFQTHGLRYQPLDPASPYIPASWTIPTEFKGSMVVFLMLLAFARAKKWIRLAVVAGAGVSWQFKRGDPDMALFCAGMLAAELSLVLPPATICEFSNKLLSQISRRTIHRLHHAIAAFWFIIALYLLSYPDHAASATPGFRTLSLVSADPLAAQIFWVSVGSILLILALMYSPPTTLPIQPTLSPASHDHETHGPDDNHYDPSTEPLFQRLFTSRLAQYLGFISYGMYLTHEHVNASLGVRYANPGYAMTEGYWDSLATLQEPALSAYISESSWNYLKLLVPGWTLNTIVVIWVGDVATRAIDMPCVQLTKLLGRWVESSEHSETRSLY